MPVVRPLEEVGNVPYWRAFTPIAESHGRKRKAVKEPRSENYNTPLDRKPGLEIYASAFIARSKKKRCGAVLWIWAQEPATSEKVLLLMRDLKPQVEERLGEPVLVERMTKHGIWTSVQRHADPDERAEWPTQHAWLAERMAKLAKAYQELVAPKLSADL
jgi:hypothetical protein